MNTTIIIIDFLLTFIMGVSVGALVIMETLLKDAHKGWKEALNGWEEASRGWKEAIGVSLEATQLVADLKEKIANGKRN